MRQLMSGAVCLFLLAACGNVDDRAVNEAKGGSSGKASTVAGAAGRASAGRAGATATTSSNGGKAGSNATGTAGQSSPVGSGGQVDQGGSAGQGSIVEVSTGGVVGSGGSSGSTSTSTGGHTVAGTTGIAGAAPEVRCTSGTKRCSANIVQICDASGNWPAAPAANQCGGTAPVCTGAGLCAAYRLVSGTIDTFGTYPTPAASAPYILKHQTLLFGYASDSTGKRICSTGANAICVTGGITPQGAP